MKAPEELKKIAEGIANNCDTIKLDLRILTTVENLKPEEWLHRWGLIKRSADEISYDLDLFCSIAEGIKCGV